LQFLSTGKKPTQDQTEKLNKQNSYLLIAEESIDSLNIFLKHYKEPKDNQSQNEEVKEVNEFISHSNLTTHHDPSDEV